jgi:hypothetical protein
VGEVGDGLFGGGEFADPQSGFARVQGRAV